MSTTTPDYLTLGEAADELRFQLWRVQKLILRKKIPETERIGGRRVVRRKDLPALRKALINLGVKMIGEK